MGDKIRYFRTDQQTDMGNYYGPHQINSGSRIRNYKMWDFEAFNADSGIFTNISYFIISLSSRADLKMDTAKSSQ